MVRLLPFLLLLLAAQGHAQEVYNTVLYGCDLGTGEQFDFPPITVPADAPVMAMTPSNTGGRSVAPLWLHQPSNPDTLQHSSLFSKKFRAADHFAIQQFPLSASGTLGSVDTLGNLGTLCTGIMVGPKHFLTAAHCAGCGHFFADTCIDLSGYPPGLVIPGYNNGQFTTDSLHSEIVRCYRFKEHYDTTNQTPWYILNDLVLLELQDSIGLQTGWVGMGYMPDEFFNQRVFQKFSYPRTPTIFYPNVNGDTMMYAFGQMDSLEQEWIKAFGHSGGNQGESGSPIILTDNESYWTTFGVLTYGNGFSHSRITTERFYALNQAFQQEVIAIDQPLSGRVHVRNSSPMLAYPNPSAGLLRIRLPQGQPQAHLQVFNQLGALVHTQPSFTSYETLDLSGLPAGVYYIKATHEGMASVITIAKQ